MRLAGVRRRVICRATHLQVPLHFPDVILESELRAVRAFNFRLAKEANSTRSQFINNMQIKTRIRAEAD